MAKACKVLVQMLADGHSVTVATRRAAFGAIRAAMGRAGARASADATRTLMQEVMAAAAGRAAVLEGLGGRAVELMKWWRLHACNVAGLLGDDTFAFAKAAKLVGPRCVRMRRGSPLAHAASISAMILRRRRPAPF